MKYTKVALLAILLIVSNVPSFPTIAATDPSIEPITGLTTPSIDGFVDLYANNNHISEWGDAKIVQLPMKSPSGITVNAQMYVKSIVDSMYFALLLPNDVNSKAIASITFQIDRDNSQDLSTGDIKFSLKRYGNDLKEVDNYDIPQFFEFSVYDSGSWKLLDQKDQNNMPLTFSWGKMVFSPRSTDNKYTSQIEMSLNLGTIEKDLSNYPTDRLTQQDVIHGDYEQLRFGLVIQGLGDMSFGYPVAADQGTEEVSVYSDAMYYDAPPIAEIPTRDLRIDNIVVMQATQKSNGRGTLIQGKDTLVRVFIGQDTGAFLPVEVELTVYKSTLFTLERIGTFRINFTAPVSPHIQHESDSANFKLAGSVVNSSLIAFVAEVRDYDGIWDSTPDNNQMVKAQQFHTNHPINIFLVPINTASSYLDPDVLPGATDIDWMKAHTKRMLPTQDVNFVELPWTMLGRLPRNDSDYIKEKLNDLFDKILATRRDAMNAGLPHYPLPHQLVGLRRSGFDHTGGSSTPTWGVWGGRARVVWIAMNNAGGSSGMMHEINHNLGPSSWGHHVTGLGYGCGAPDGTFSNDGDWDSLYGDNIIHDIGFMPEYGLISAFTPEVMTYCAAPDHPRTWLGSYRWELLYTRLQSLTLERTAIGASSPSLDAIAGHSYRTITGSITKTGKGVIDPSFEFPGTPDFSDLNITAPEAQVAVKYLNGSTLTVPIRVNFRDIENTTVDETHFSITVPDNGQVTSISLYETQNGQILDSKSASDLQAYTNLNYPSSAKLGESIFATWYLQANNATNLYSQLLFSPDGNGYLPIGSPTTSDTATVSLNGLPGGANSHFRVLISDGVNTTYVDGPTIWVEQPAPKVVINENLFKKTENGTRIPATNQLQSIVGASIPFSVTAQDAYGWKLPLLSYDLIDTISNTVLTHRNRAVTKDDFPHLILDEPGTYVARVTGVSPSTGISSTDTITIIVSRLPNQSSINDVNSFYDTLTHLRNKYGDSQQDNSSKDKNSLPFNLPWQTPLFWLIPMFVVIKKIRISKNKNYQ